jgi:hypothetical protein
MPIIKTRPIDRIINGQIITSSEVSLVSEPYYDCSGESVIIVKNINFYNNKSTHTSTFIT